MTTGLYPDTGYAATGGHSDAAQSITYQLEQAHAALQKSHALGFKGRGVFDELSDVYAECCAPNWDGYDALPVLYETYVLADKFLDAFPIGTKPPSIGAEADGHITVEWYRSPRETLSVSIGPNSQLHYAALLGPSKHYGSEPFYGCVPSAIMSLLNTVTRPSRMAA